MIGAASRFPGLTGFEHRLSNTFPSEISSCRQHGLKPVFGKANEVCDV